MSSLPGSNISLFGLLHMKIWNCNTSAIIDLFETTCCVSASLKWSHIVNAISFLTKKCSLNFYELYPPVPPQQIRILNLVLSSLGLQAIWITSFSWLSSPSLIASLVVETIALIISWLPSTTSLHLWTIPASACTCSLCLPNTTISSLLHQIAVLFLDQPCQRRLPACILSCIYRLHILGYPLFRAACSARNLSRSIVGALQSSQVRPWFEQNSFWSMKTYCETRLSKT